MRKKLARARVKCRAEGTRTNVSFETIGTDFDLDPGEVIFLDLPLEDLSALEVIVCDNGVAFWLPYSGDHTVLDKDGKEIAQL